MNLDLLPFSAFALESSGAAARAVSEAQTLTLQLVPHPIHSFYQPMGGSASIHCAPAGASGTLRASVVPADGTALTITF